MAGRGANRLRRESLVSRSEQSDSLGKRTGISALFLVGLSLFLASLPLPNPALSQAAQDAVVIPNFWDPRPERVPAPALEGVRFTTTDDFPPFNFTDADGRLVGFNVDLARAICSELGVPCTIQSRPFEDLIAAMADDRADAAIAGIAINPGTRAEVLFSDIYLRLPARFAVRQGGLTEVSPNALIGKEVAVVAGSTHEAFLRDFFSAAIIAPFPDGESARAALREGEVNALFGDGMLLAFWLESQDSDGCCAFAGGPYLEAAYFGQGFAVAVRPDREDIVTAINAALFAVYADGIYDELYLRYFPRSFY